MAPPLFVNTWKTKILYTWVTIAHSWQACYIGPGMCFGSSPPPSPPPKHTHTHTQEKSIQECSDLRIGCLTCCLKHTSTTTPCKKKKNHEANTNHKHGLQEEEQQWEHKIW
jgi:hypothetical protein